MAKYDYLQAYDAARNNVYGDQSSAVMERIRGVAGQDFIDAQKAGIIKEDGSVDWEKAPALAGYNSAGGNAAPNMMLQATGGRAGMVNPDGSAITQGFGGRGLVNNDDYGSQYVAQRRAPDDMGMKLGRGLAMAMFMGPTAATFAPLISGGLGLSGGGWNSAISTVLRSLPGLAQSGGQGWESVLGRLAGGATGIPGGSTIGGFAGSYASMTPAQREALRRSIGGG